MTTTGHTPPAVARLHNAHTHPATRNRAFAVELVANEARNTRRAYTLHVGDALDAYKTWTAPDVIVSDGAYGVGGFPGDPRTPDGLADWYRPHIEEWSRLSKLSTSLWFFNTEVGWANVHPVLIANGWKYEQTVVWDKGLGHVAGNSNSQTLRRFPVVTEVFVRYTRELVIPTVSGDTHAQQWLVGEWLRAGLRRSAANAACGVKNAASRKYFDQGWLWYPPSGEVFAMLADYANEHGKPDGAPYYSQDGVRPITAEEWDGFRGVWNYEHGLSNVWQHPALRGKERWTGSGVRSAPRVYKPGANAATHLNQKPLELMTRLIACCPPPEGVVWEPFGGLCSASVAALNLGRVPFASEHNEFFAEMAGERLDETVKTAALFRHGIDPDRVTDAQAREALAAVRGGS